MPSADNILDSPDIQNLLRLFVELIGSGLITNTSQFSCFFRCALSKTRYEANSASIKRIAAVFREKNLIASEQQNFNVLIDGRAAFESGQTPTLYLKRKAEFLELKTKPIFMCDAFFIHLMMRSTRLFRIPESVRIDLDPFEQAQMSNIIDINAFDFRPIHSKLSRAFTTLAIMDAINERSFASISTRFGCGNGDVQEMLNHAQQEAKMCLSMCEALKEEDPFWNDMYNLLKPRLRRIIELCKPEILPLLELNSNESTPYIDVAMARAFFQAGIRTIPGLASRSSQEIRAILEQHQYCNEETDLTQVCSRLMDRVHERLLDSPSLELSTLQSPDSANHKRKRLFNSASDTQLFKKQRTTQLACRIIFENPLWNPKEVTCAWYEDTHLVKETSLNLNRMEDREKLEILLTDGNIQKQWMGVQWTLKEVLDLRHVAMSNVVDPIVAFFLMNPHLRDLRLNDFKKTNKSADVMDKEFLNWIQVLEKIRTRYQMNSTSSVHILCDRILTEWEAFKTSNLLENHSAKMLHKQFVNDSYMAVICAEMECYGVNFNSRNFAQLQSDAEMEMEEAIHKIRDMFYQQTNKPLKWSYDDDGMYSAQTKESLIALLHPVDPSSISAKKCLNKDNLQVCINPIAALILKFQRAQYVRKRCSCVFKRSSSDMSSDRVFSQWTILANPNLRFTSRTPNIQNIPKEQSGSRLGMRTVFGARDGCILIGADYNHIELRIAAYLAHDEELIERLSEGDMFSDMAEELGHSRDEIKRLVYSVLYGRSRKRVDEDISNSEVSTKFWKVFETLLAYRNMQQKKVIDSGFIRTALLHRTMQVRGTNENPYQMDRKQSLRVAWNYHVSGTASEIVREAMRKIHMIIQRESSMIHSQSAYRHPVALLVVQLHDELIYEVEKTFADRFICILNDSMSQLVNGWRLPVKIKRGDNWGNMYEVKLSQHLSPL
uniref:DNA-directed DNA polymerase family A palm domain-containing protein n=2 Tax=Percolomonas cosmopolitus TaxID=63605 RepID=A0A7S1KNA7_9EUKA